MRLLLSLLLFFLSCIQLSSVSGRHLFKDPVFDTSGIGPEKVDNWAGYITVNTTRHLWYWFFESRSSPSTDPFVLWMTGGPGCSSLVALFYENGPYHINNDLSLSLNPYSWNSFANVLWIDQPVGTGFSYADEGDIGVVTEDEMADNMYEFLQKFLTQYPKYQAVPFFITGESYAGHYVPALGARVYRGNVNHEGITLNLKGLAIGNGLVDPLIQYSQYPAYAKDHNVVTIEQYGYMEAVLGGCLALISGCAQNSTLGWLACYNAYIVCNMGEVAPIQLSGKYNVYDVREPCTVPPLCYDFSLVDKFLAQPSIQAALGVKKSWVDCNRIVDLKLVLAGDWMLDYADDVKTMLANDITVTVYNGEYDFICNWYGSHAWTHALQWPGQQAFNSAANTTWTVNGVEAGTATQAQGFTFLRVKDAGHMVPMNQPQNALSMLKTIFEGGQFN